MTGTSTTTTADYRTTVRFAKPASAVVEALTTAPGIASWWTTRVGGSGTDGGELRLAFPNSDYEDVVLAVATIEQPCSIVWTVRAVPPVPAWEEWAGTRVVVRVEPEPSGGTRMDLHHEGLTPQLDCYDLCSGGWDYVLASLRAHVDAGAGRPIS
jgi:uncharacterized protein YndB with AHSA1/START domain